MSFLRQCSRWVLWALTRGEYKDRITSHDLLATVLLMQPRTHVWPQGAGNADSPGDLQTDSGSQHKDRKDLILAEEANFRSQGTGAQSIQLHSQWCPGSVLVTQARLSPGLMLELMLKYRWSFSMGQTLLCSDLHMGRRKGATAPSTGRYSRLSSP